jgi:hypothetical protein
MLPMLAGTGRMGAAVSTQNLYQPATVHRSPEKCGLRCSCPLRELRRRGPNPRPKLGDTPDNRAPAAPWPLG